MPAKFTLSGVKEMNAKVRSVMVKHPDRVMAALYIEGQIEMTESKRRVPVDTGTLRASGFVDRPVRSGNSISVTLSYGGAAETYAIIVHETPPELVFHRIGQWKYLESVLNESAPHMASRLAHRLDLDKAGV